MPKFASENIMLFNPVLAANFGVICICIRTSVISPKEGGEGFKIIGIRFLIGGIVSIILTFIIKYFEIIKYLLKQISYKGKLEVFTKLSGKSISMNELSLSFEIRSGEIFVSAFVSLKLQELSKATARNQKEKLYSKSQLCR
jgi:hypothetical protein